MHDMTVSWTRPDGAAGSVPLRADKAYLSPNGYRVTVAQQPHDPSNWTLVGHSPPTSCHKPATVSGGGKSEISKAITDAFIVGSAFVADLDTDMDAVTAILDRDFSRRFLDPERNGTDLRPILSQDRSIGSVIKLLTPSRSEYHPDYNAWLSRIPPYVKELVYVVKHSYRPEWGDDWRKHFTVDDRRAPRQRAAIRPRQAHPQHAPRGLQPDGAGAPSPCARISSPAEKIQVEGRHHRFDSRSTRPGRGRARGPQEPLAEIRLQLRGTIVPAAGRRHRARLRQAHGA